MNKAVILDRDGTINYDVQGGYVHRTEDLKFIPGAKHALKMFYDAGYLLLIMTNQSGIGRGLYSEEQYRLFMNDLYNSLFASGIRIEKDYFCPHLPNDNCNCRKPLPGMHIHAIADFDLDTQKCVVIGDQFSDLIPMKNMGCNNLYLVRSERKLDEKNEIPCKKLNNIEDVACEILGDEK